MTKFIEVTRLQHVYAAIAFLRSTGSRIRLLTRERHIAEELSSCLDVCRLAGCVPGGRVVDDEKQVAYKLDAIQIVLYIRSFEL